MGLFFITLLSYLFFERFFLLGGCRWTENPFSVLLVPFAYLPLARFFGRAFFFPPVFRLTIPPTLAGRPNSLIKPRASAESYSAPMVKLAKSGM